MRLVCGAKVRGVRRLGVLAAVQDIVALNLLRGAAKPVLGSLPFFTIIILSSYSSTGIELLPYTG